MLFSAPSACKSEVLVIENLVCCVKLNWNNSWGQQIDLILVLFQSLLTVNLFFRCVASCFGPMMELSHEMLLCFLSDEIHHVQSGTNDAKQEIQQLRKELSEAQDLAKTSRQKCLELQGEIGVPG